VRGATRIRARLRRAGFELDVDVGWSERVAVLFGPSGAGKTLFLETVLGLHRDPQARVELAGEVLEDPGRGVRVPVHERRLGWVPQESALFPHLRVEGNLRLGLARAGGDGDRLRRAVEVLEIGGLLQRPVRELSGGERQRVAVARALVNRPGLLLCDEPTGSLDQATAARVAELLMELHEAEKTILILVTHSLGLAGHAARRLELTEGRCSAA
jgi:molybdate transport system ATP-binding protein